MEFKIEGNKFLKDGKEIKILSGAVHYFRNMPESWDSIFEKMRALGLNTVETYCAWNLHEERPGEFSFDGLLDIAGFIRCAERHGLMAIVRPGPYICAEWEFGGLPWWLSTIPNMEIRCMNESYIKYFERYLERLFAQLRPLLCTNGGNIIMMQCENEYGYYGDDREYLLHLRDTYRRLGIDVPLFTSDGHRESDLLDGSIDGCLATLNFGSAVEERFKAHDKLFPSSPKMCMEMWCGWFDAWGDKKHHTTSAEDYAKTASDMARRGSLNIYMFIGGTNFGFTNGANHLEKFMPDVTSYDYDALLSECGDVTEKYLAVREVLKQYSEGELPPIPQNRPKAAYGKVKLTEYARLSEQLDRICSPIHSNVPLPMESYGEGYGYILYKTSFDRSYDNATLSFEELGDRAQIFIGDRLERVLYINDDEKPELKISAEEGDTLSILVENMGRTNFGDKMMRKKGIVGRVLLDSKIHFSWDVYPLPMRELSALRFRTGECERGFFRGKFEVKDKKDSFLRTDNFTKGFVMINGFNLGRYWEIGPQKTLYVPSSVLREGENEIILFESDKRKGEQSIEFTDKPDLG